MPPCRSRRASGGRPAVRSPPSTHSIRRTQELSAVDATAERKLAASARDNQRGLGLFEVVAGTLIATIAVLGLAYSFGVGRGMIDRYQVARAGLGEGQLMMD